jgi:Mn2+/Fe2+ NRAMP family transporter
MNFGNSTVRNWARIFGPAWLVMMADIDIASIVTGLQAGATWGYRMIFIMLALVVPLFVIQDAAGRLGTAGGMGLGEAISKFFGRRIAVAAALPMAVSDFLEYVAEYAGMAIGFRLLGLPVVFGLFVTYLIHTAIVVRRRYREAEMVLIPLSFLVVVSVLVSVFLFRVDVGRLFSLGLSPIQPYGDPSFQFLMAASIGAVVMPWMLYFHSGADSRKKLQASDLRFERLETLIGAIVSEILMGVIVLDGSHLSSTTSFLSTTELAKALSPLGAQAPLIMGAGFLWAGFLALVVISMGSAWGVMEALEKRSRGALLSVYAAESLPALAVVLLVSDYVQLMLSLMVIYTIIIVPSLYLLGRLISDPRAMNSERYSRREMALYWLMSACVVAGGIVGLTSVFY